MKQSDIITIVLITMIGTIAAGFATNAILGNPDDAKETWKTIEVVDPSLTPPDSEVFNASAINPTVEVYVGNCEDVDHDGTLSQAERIACGWTRAKAQDEEENKQENGTDGILTPEDILNRRTTDGTNTSGGSGTSGANGTSSGSGASGTTDGSGTSGTSGTVPGTSDVVPSTTDMDTSTSDGTVPSVTPSDGTETQSGDVVPSVGF